MRSLLKLILFIRTVRPNMLPSPVLMSFIFSRVVADEIIELVKDRLTVHEISVIAVNEITEQDLKILFPDITPIQIEEFFKKRDGDQETETEGKRFETAEEFKELIVKVLAILDDKSYDDRMKEFEAACLESDAGKLFSLVVLDQVGAQVMKSRPLSISQSSRLRQKKKRKRKRLIPIIRMIRTTPMTLTIPMIKVLMIKTTIRTKKKKKSSPSNCSPHV